MPWAANRALAQPGKAARPPGPFFYDLVVTGTRAICEGGRAVLTAQGGYYSGGGVTYAWSPDAAISTTSGSTVVVGPLQNTAYTVTATSTYQGNPVVSTATVTVTVAANCCEQSVAPGSIVELTSTDYFANPFTGPPGTRYHATGSLTLNGNVLYRLPVGGQLLLDDFATLTLTERAVLELPGASLSATCDSMWNRVEVTGRAGGVRMAMAGSLPTFVGHSYGGIYWAESTDPKPPFFQLQQAVFRENRQSLELHRLAPSQSTDYIVKCDFSSTPSKFKSRFRYRNGTNYRYALRHLAFDGNLAQSDISANLFDNAVFGVYSGRGNDLLATVSTATLNANIYTNCWLAGVYIDDAPGTLNVFESRFDFPTAAALPPTPQISQAISQDTHYPAPATYGIFSFNSTLTADKNQFTQSSTGSYATYDYSLYRTVQKGIFGRNVQRVSDSRFISLQVGLHTDMGGSAGAGNGTFTVVQGNLSQECPYGTILQGGSLSTPATPAYPFVSCNTYQVLTTKTGSAYCTGIYIQPRSWVKLEDPTATSPQTAPLKNLFVDDPSQYGNQRAIGNASTYTLDYFTFSNYVADYQLYSINNTYVQNSGVASSAANGCAVDHFPNNGIQYRSAVKNQGLPQAPSEQSETFLTPSIPNPASTQASFRYQSWHFGPHATRTLIIRDLLSGREINSVVLPSMSGEYVLNVQGWRPGLYVATLVVDGISRQHRRFAVTN